MAARFVSPWGDESPVAPGEEVTVFYVSALSGAVVRTVTFPFTDYHINNLSTWGLFRATDMCIHISERNSSGQLSTGRRWDENLETFLPGATVPLKYDENMLPHIQRDNQDRPYITLHIVRKAT
jgi:hypothetical protein